MKCLLSLRTRKVMRNKKVILSLFLLLTYFAGISSDLASSSKDELVPITEEITFQSASVESPTQALKVEFDSESCVRSKTILYSPVIISIVIQEVSLLPKVCFGFPDNVSHSVHSVSSVSTPVILRKLRL